jgi:hypothetical protein
MNGGTKAGFSSVSVERVQCARWDSAGPTERRRTRTELLHWALSLVTLESVCLKLTTCLNLILKSRSLHLSDCVLLKNRFHLQFAVTDYDLQFVSLGRLAVGLMPGMPRIFCLPMHWDQCSHLSGRCLKICRCGETARRVSSWRWMCCWCCRFRCVELCYACVLLYVKHWEAVPTSERNILLLHSSTALSEFAFFCMFSRRRIISQRKYFFFVYITWS